MILMRLQLYNLDLNVIPIAVEQINKPLQNDQFL